MAIEATDFSDVLSIGIGGRELEPWKLQGQELSDRSWTRRCRSVAASSGFRLDGRELLWWKFEHEEWQCCLGTRRARVSVMEFPGSGSSRRQGSHTRGVISTTLALNRRSGRHPGLPNSKFHRASSSLSRPPPPRRDPELEIPLQWLSTVGSYIGQTKTPEATGHQIPLRWLSAGEPSDFFQSCFLSGSAAEA